MNIIKSFLQDQFERRGLDITIDGSGPYDIQIYDYPRMLKAFLYGSLGLGEAYMEGTWDCENIDQLFYNLCGEMSPLMAMPEQLNTGLLTGLQSVSGKVGQKHYDIGNDLYEAMLGDTMTYTCGVWRHGAWDLNTAQIEKLATITRKLQIDACKDSEDTRILDIGSGWGSLGHYLATRLNHTRITGLTISQEQVNYANERNDTFRFVTRNEDYRHHVPAQPYNRIASVGMFEHVGHRFYRTFFNRVHDLLANNGLFVLHTITSPKTKTTQDPWLVKYIFPYSEIPAEWRILKAASGLFRLEGSENIGGSNYDKTLMAWWNNFDDKYRRGHLDQSKYNKEFYRMWELYIKAAAGNMRAQKMSVQQYVFSKI